MALSYNVSVCSACLHSIAAIVTSIQNGVGPMADSVPPMRPIYPRTQYSTQYMSASRVHNTNNDFSPPCSGACLDFSRTMLCRVLSEYIYNNYHKISGTPDVTSTVEVLHVQWYLCLGFSTCK